MTNGVSAFWCNWLIAVAAAVSLFSALLLFAPAVGQQIFDAIYFFTLEPQPLPAERETNYLRFTNGVLGAVMIGWMCLIAVVANGPFRRGEAWAWTAIAASIGAWFVTDTTFSLARGVTGNALFNTAVVVAFAVPLLASRASFRRLS
ncbi:MAG: hypothetical protein ACKVRO_05980 [Micropepsaceae bacterium]